MGGFVNKRKMVNPKVENGKSGSGKWGRAETSDRLRKSHQKQLSDRIIRVYRIQDNYRISERHNSSLHFLCIPYLLGSFDEQKKGETKRFYFRMCYKTTNKCAHNVM